MKEKIIITLIIILMVALVSFMTYMAITNPYEYPGYEISTPPVYSPWPAG
jgi:uncharacterized protein YpmB